MAKDPKSPATTSEGFDCMIGCWTKIQTVLDGTEAMRAAKNDYLPMHSNEEVYAYEERRKTSVLVNITAQVLDGWVGRPFSQPIALEEVPKEVEECLEDIDLQCNDLHVFCRNWFRDGLAKGLSHVYIDMPRPSPLAEGAVRTKSDDRGMRPYWVHIRPENLFFASAEIIDGQEVLQEIRIMEEVEVRDGFATTCEKQIRRVFLENGKGYIELYMLKKVKGRKPQWIIVDAYSYDLDVIPLVTFYSNRSGFMETKPPLEDVADLNVAHWQSGSDQRSILTVARFPMLAQSGGTDDGTTVKVGPRRMLYDSNPNTKFYYVEHTGAAIEAGRQDLMDLEEKMANYGAEFLKRKPGEQTATARALDSAESTSPLMDVTMRFSDALSNALDMTAKWLGMDDGGDATLVTDFGPEFSDQAELDALKETRKNKDLSLKTYLEELKRRGILPADLDVDKEIAQLEQEMLALLPAIGPLEEPAPMEEPV